MNSIYEDFAGYSIDLDLTYKVEPTKLKELIEAYANEMCSNLEREGVGVTYKLTKRWT